MAGRMNNVSTSGEILINGSAAKEYIASGRVAYVQQNDTLLPYLTGKALHMLIQSSFHT